MGDVRSLAFGTGFEVAILLWNSFGYSSDQENLDLLERAGAAMRPGGRFILEMLNRDYLLRNFAARSEREVDGIRVVEEREFDILRSRIRSRITRYEALQSQVRHTDWRVYSLHELRAMGQSAGFGLRQPMGAWTEARSHWTRD